MSLSDTIPKKQHLNIPSIQLEPPMQQAKTLRVMECSWVCWAMVRSSGKGRSRCRSNKWLSGWASITVVITRFIEGCCIEKTGASIWEILKYINQLM